MRANVAEVATANAICVFSAKFAHQPTQKYLWLIKACLLVHKGHCYAIEL